MKNYDDTYSSCKRTYSILRIFHEDLDPEDINKILGLSYTIAHRQGDPISARHPEKGKRDYGAWLLESEQWVDSRDSRRHIDWLLDQIEGNIDLIQDLFSKGYSIDIYCHWESAYGQGGPTVSPEQSTRLGEMNIDLIFDVYFSYSEED